VSVTQITAPNKQIEAANGVRYAYRRYGNAETSALPLLCFQHYRGNLDNWDPILVDSLAAEREVILLDNAGVGGSTGRVPSTIAEMAIDAVAFTDALGLRSYDLHGFSMGGFVAQEVALTRPHQLRRLVLAGTAPQGGRHVHGWTGEILSAAIVDEPGADELLTLFFERTDTSRAKGQEFIQRIFTRTEARDDPTDLATRDAQASATAWGVPDDTRLNRLAGIPQPTLVANGDNDLVVPTENTHLLGEYLRNATVSIYPDAGHGFLFQEPAAFAAEVNDFLGH
jgi:pimeloyl-ACP methyl ester carboxylesterase